MTFDAVSLTICSSESWAGSFIAGTAPSFSIKPCANPASNWALFIKRSSTKHLRNSIAAPEKQTISTVHVTVGSSGSWTRLSFPHNQKHTSLEMFFPSESRAASLPIEACWLAALAPVDACTGVFFREKCPYKEFHRRLRHQEQRSKKTLRNLYESGSEIFGTEILCYTSSFVLNFVHA